MIFVQCLVHEHGSRVRKFWHAQMLTEWHRWGKSGLRNYRQQMALTAAIKWKFIKKFKIQTWPLISRAQELKREEIITERSKSNSENIANRWHCKSFFLAKITFVELIFRRDFVEANDSEKKSVREARQRWLGNCEVRSRAGLDPLWASLNFFVSRMCNDFVCVCASAALKVQRCATLKNHPLPSGNCCICASYFPHAFSRFFSFTSSFDGQNFGETTFSNISVFFYNFDFKQQK
jgi:hypothetical protein